ncbi:ABC transporter substrate-binding protein [Ideonella sp.]|uniref:ABC transporter substrate-binding protein n=1 Tax=Ideonella sp. TaxID=1929293 RepID=UPI003BB7EC31
MRLSALAGLRRRTLLSAALLLGVSLAAQAQETAIKFQLDWRFEGPSAFFLLPVAKGQFKAEKLAVSIDAGNGSGNAVNRVASGAYDMGFADLAALMEFHANNPTAPNKPVAVMMVYNNTPAAVFALKKSGIKAPADLGGKKLGAPVFDAGRRAFPIFQKANGVGKAEWISMDPALRETMLAKGDVDAITGFYFTSLLNLEARGVKLADLVVMPYPQFGVKLYGNAIIVGEDFLKKNPEAVKAFLRAFTKGAKEVLANPKAATAVVKERDGIINADLEERRLKLAIESSVVTADARTEGFGDVSKPRLALMASQVADAFNTKGRINPDAVWNGSYLPSVADRNILGK